MIGADLVESGGQWLTTHRADAVEDWLAERALEMHCPYIYPPVSRYGTLHPENVYSSPSDWDRKAPALYVHIPYCLLRCSFCNFALDELRDASAPVDEYLEALAGEAEQILARTGRSRLRVSSLYVGGGTPSVLSLQQLERFFALLERYVELEPGAEFSFEVNPDTVKGPNRRKLALMRQAGVSRVSLGVQSMDAEILRYLRRLHTPTEVEAAVEAVRAAGIEHLNVDLMYALPDLTPERWLATLERTTALGPDSITLYELRISPTSQINVLEAKRPGHPNLDRAMGLLFLQRAGYLRSSPNQYLSGWEHVHQHYVDVREHLTDIVGLGVSAIARIGPWAFQAPLSLKEYMEQNKTGRMKYRGMCMNGAEQCTRAALLGIKSPRGLSLSAYQQRLGMSVEAIFPEVLAALRERDLIEVTSDHVRTTDLGSFFMDQISTLFFQEEDTVAVRTREVNYLGVYWHA